MPFFGGCSPLFVSTHSFSLRGSLEAHFTDEDTGLERLTDSPKVTETVLSRARTRTHILCT